VSALNDDLGGVLNVLVDVPRAMSPTEVRDFLMTGVFPNLSKPPPEEASEETFTQLTETDARLWLGTMTAAGGFGPSEIEMAYNPSQPRDAHGRWTKSVGVGDVIDEIKSGQTRRRALTEPDEVLAAAPVSLDESNKISCRPPEMTTCSDSSAGLRTDALLSYRGYDYDMMNSILRGTYDEDVARSDFSPENDEEWENHKAMIDDYMRRIDETMSASRLEDDVIVTRGTATGRGIFGDALKSDLTGWSWTEKGYVSTTADPDVAEIFGGTGLVMRIRVPSGTGAVKLSGTKGDAKKITAGEAELLLQKGLTMRVVRDNGRDADGTRRLDVEVVP